MGGWFRAHRRQLSRILGALMLIAGVVLLYWDNRGSGVSEEERIAAANVARMEARMRSQHAGSAASDKPIFGTSYREKQRQQLRYAVITLMVLGAGFMLYGFLKKEE
jgi:uncharacterized protein YjeT (DUF2065 family)